MIAPEPALWVHLQAHREQAQLSRAELATRAGLSRQSVHAIEAGTLTPSVLLALQLARALQVSVEALFTLPTATLEACWPHGSFPDVSARVQLAHIAGRWLAFPLTGDQGLRLSADGLVCSAEGKTVQVTPLTELNRLRTTAVISGCDPALGLLAASLHGPQGRVVWHSATSLDALQAVARGEAHAAGLHLYDAAEDESNVAAVRQELAGRDVHLLTLWDWQQGLMVAAGNPQGVQTAADLASGQVRLMNRGPGAGSRLLLDSWLDQVGVGRLERLDLPGYTTAAASHLDAARSVAQGQADAAPGPAFAARAFGLDFVPLQQERYDLAVPAEHLAHPGVQALLHAARSPAFQAEQRALGGYTITQPGQLWQTVS